jgi:rhodanese-related sulfurtransferase
MDHSTEFLALVNDAKSRVREVSVEETIDRQAEGALVIDVREDNEFETAHVKGARHMGRGIIERDIISAVPDKDREIILYCGGGFRSALAADNLQKMGYTNVWSMAGGWHAWEEAGASVETRYQS